MSFVAGSLMRVFIVLSVVVSGAVPHSNQQAGTIVFASDRDGHREIYAIRPDGMGATNLTHDAGRDQAPAVSPNGDMIAFTSDRSGTLGLWIMGIEGGRPRLVAELPRADFGWAWSPDDATIAWSYQRPDDGTHDLAVIDVASGEWRLLTDTPGVDEITPAWTADGTHLLFFRDDNDGTYLHSLNVADRTQTRISASSLPGGAFPDVSPDGTRVVARARGEGGFDIVEIELASGTVVTRVGGPASDWGASWSPSATHIAFHSDRGGSVDIFTLEFSTGAIRQVTHNAARDWNPTWASGRD